MDAQAQLDEAEQKRARGDEAGALAAYLAAGEEARKVFDPAREAAARLGAGEMHRLLDDDEKARTAFDEAVARAMEGGVAVVEADAWFALAQLAFDHGRSKDGHDALLECMALCRDLGGEDGRRRLARAVRLYGEHIGVLGSEPEARQALVLAKAMFEAMGDEASARGVDEDLAKLSEFSR